jgi:hypothetical protein
MKFPARLMALTLVAGLVGSGLALAHEGHVHKLMGTVSAFHADSKTIEVRTLEGRVETVSIGDTTRITRGSASKAVPASTDNLKAGLRIVVNYQEVAGLKNATEVRLSTRTAAKPPTANAPLKPSPDPKN